MSHEVDQIWSRITDSPRGLVDFDEAFRQLLLALEADARADPAAFAAVLLSRVAAFTGYLTLRTHHRISRLLSNSDTAAGKVAQDMILRLVELQTHLVDVLHAQAATARLWSLTRRGKTEEADPLNRPSGQPGREVKGSGRRPVARGVGVITPDDEGEGHAGTSGRRRTA